MVVILPALIYFIPRDWLFDEGHTFCLFRNLTGNECWGCGMIRALTSVAYCDFAAAWEYNHFVVIVAPLLVYIWIKWIVRLAKESK